MPHHCKLSTCVCLCRSSHTTHLHRPCFCKAEIFHIKPNSENEKEKQTNDIEDFLRDMVGADLNVSWVIEDFFRGSKGGTFFELAASSTTLYALPRLLPLLHPEPDTRRRRRRDFAWLCLGRLTWPACHADYAKTGQSHCVGHFVDKSWEDGGGLGLFKLLQKVSCSVLIPSRKITKI